jgi:hypothetical protein
LFDTQGSFVRKMPREAEDGAGGIIAFDRKLHGGRVAEEVGS